MAGYIAGRLGQSVVVLFLVIPASAILWLVLMFKAYQGEEFKLPIVGPIAADRI